MARQGLEISDTTSKRQRLYPLEGFRWTVWFSRMSRSYIGIISMYESIRIIRIGRNIAFISEPSLQRSTQPSLTIVTPRRILSRPDDQQAFLKLFVAEQICSAARPAVLSSGGKAVQGGRSGEPRG
ncbi:hypothetical protein MMC29_006687 [Sticta canariensis]|nr:hypothetical protein [Sticta canariensis]